MAAPVACTIVANNYLAHARAFTQSFLERHPDGQVHVLIVDRPLPGHDYGREPFAVTFVHELGIPAFPAMAFRYSILELSTAVKPSYLLWLHRAMRLERLCYFDPDILVLGDLGELYARLAGADAVLTPHLTEPLGDAYAPSELRILQSGTYNLGFLGVSYNTRTLPFLTWWARHLDRECLHEVAQGLFVDQRWMDFAPSFLPHVDIVREPGYNAAYWNLAHRPVTRDGDAWRIDGAPLRFFHYSGYDVREPETISRFQNRLSFEERPDLRPLFALYRERLGRHGYDRARGAPYGYGHFDNGVRVPALARRGLSRVDPEARRWPDPFSTLGADSFFEWLRQPMTADSPVPRIAFMLWDRRPDLQTAFPSPWREDAAAFAEWFGRHAVSAELIDRALVPERLGSPARPDGGGPTDGAPWTIAPETLTAGAIAWLTAEAGDDPARRPRVPWLALEMHRQRPDLQREYLDPLGADREAMALWYTTSGRDQYGLPPALVLPIARTLGWRRRAWVHSRWRQSPRDRAAVPFPTVAPAPPAPERKGPSGPGAAEGVNVVGFFAAPTGVGEMCRNTMAALTQASLASGRWDADARSGASRMLEGIGFDATLYHVNADSIEAVHARLPTALLDARHRIGYWFWELAHFPLAFAGAFRHLSQVWAPSRFCLEAYRQIAPVEVRWVPPCVPPTRAVPASRAALAVDPDAFVFLFTFDVMSYPARKNPLGVLAAFSQVSRQSRRPVHLVLKVNQPEADPVHVAHLRRRSTGLPVTLLTGTLSREDVNGLTAVCDAYVSLHRSEGLGLTLIEAMYLGKPVIATGYGGVTDFFGEETGYPVAYRLTTLDQPHGPYPAGAVWAEPDVDHAASLMLALAGDPAAAASRIEAARRRVQALYAPEVAGPRFRAELARLRGTSTGSAG